MSENKLYGIAALFDSPDDIINAAKKVSGSGYTDFDVHTPYPVHGMNKAMKLKPTKLGFVSLGAGIIGATSIVAFILWVTLVDYPLIIGGKPFFAWPAFVPVIFEVLVLSTTIITVATMLFIMFRFPNNSHPLHDTNYMKSVSSDKFGICIKKDDPIFNENETEVLLRSLSPLRIEKIYWNEEEQNVKISLFNIKFIGALIVIFIITSVVTYIVLNKVLFMPPFDWMMNQEKLIPQKSSTFFDDGFGMRTPPKFSVMKGSGNFNLITDTKIAEEKLINPVMVNEKSLKLGKEKFLTFCSPCHGNLGFGDSRLKGQFPNPPTLHSEKIITMKDGGIFYIINKGQNVMPGYNTQLTAEESWAIINYIRVLQRATNAKESDLK